MSASLLSLDLRSEENGMMSSLTFDLSEHHFSNVAN